MALVRGKFISTSDITPNLEKDPYNIGIYGKNHILQAIRSLGFLNIDSGPWVAGGAARRLLNNEKTGGDIDIFLSDNVASRHSIDVLESRYGITVNKGSRDHKLMSFKLKADDRQFDQPIQVINKKFESIDALLNDFDFTICMVATDGWDWIADERLFKDMKNKSLVIHNSDQRSGRHDRLTKYCAYGFTPGPGVVDTMLNFDKMDFDANGVAISKYKSDYDDDE